MTTQQLNQNQRTQGKTAVWHEQTIAQCANILQVDTAVGLTPAEVQQRQQQYGTNKLAEGKTESTVQAFLRQYKDFMQIILLAAAGGSLFIGDFSSAIMLVALTLLNAVMGLRQEAKAADSLAALQQMMKLTTRARRNGDIVEVNAEEIVPGDVVLFEAGDKVPADGRLLVAATLEIEEAALTGESTPVLKQTEAVSGADIPVGDRTDMAYMQSSVTRGRGEMLVTATGMDTEVGSIANMLNQAEVGKSPLTKQIDHLTLIIAALAGAALVLIIIIGLANGDSLDDLFTVGIALAIAAIPTGMPIVLTTVLSIGVTDLAKKNAIVKRLPAVETLGSTSAICSDKTGTLTLNQMTARKFFIAGYQFNITGEGYSSEGQISHIGGQAPVSLDPFLLPMALCADAVVEDDGNLIGDPTEGALVTLAAKGGLNVDMTRQTYPRIAEVPFDSAYKFMATFHNMTNAAGEAVVRCYVKGAPDVIIDRSATARGKDGRPVALQGAEKERLLAGNEKLASEGLRVMVVAQKDFDPQTFDPEREDLTSLVDELMLLAMVGIVDPPRPEAKTAIAECKLAGIQVRMITGDHAATAAAIGAELGITGRAITGKQFAAMSDEDLTAQIDEIGVIARVAPEHKVRLVKILQAKGNIVAMTGDGVNDAPALKNADIGVAMGITGTEVSKDAATMILTDDNFATIVTAVKQGRVIYDNLMKYIRFQMAVLVGFILAFLGAAVLGVAGAALFTPLQILWINFIVDAPIGTMLGFDTESPGLMQQKPRPANTPIITRPLAIRFIIIGLLMAIVTLVVAAWTAATYNSAAMTQTMAMTTFSLTHFAVALNLRNPKDSVFRMDSFENRKLWITYGLVFVAIVLATELSILQKVLNTTGLNTTLWTIAIGISVGFLLLGEIAKFILRKIKQ
jgi:Ca2+-transporting ATPase